MPDVPTNPNEDPDRGASRSARDREPSGLQQSNDDEAAEVDRASEARYEAIAEAAYRRAQQRGFEPGYELDDWLAAEREIKEREGSGGIG
jgi:hypothetical protein